MGPALAAAVFDVDQEVGAPQGELLWLRDLGQGGRGAEATAFELTVLLLLQQLAAHQAHDRRVVSEDSRPRWCGVWSPC
jgi:hypothetical protein